jgi:hypothetical protein
MKKSLLISLLCIAAIGANAQSTDQTVTTNTAVCKTFPNKPARAVPVFPKTAYTPLEDPSCPPCYEYRSKYGYMVMECPYVRFAPEHGNKELTSEEAVTLPYNASSIDADAKTETTVQAETQHVYTGNYPAVCLRSPNMPKGAKQVFPKSEYTALEDASCPPCYEYRSKYGYMVMECPFLRFAPEHSNKQ